MIKGLRFVRISSIGRKNGVNPVIRIYPILGLSLCCKDVIWLSV